MAHGFVGRNHGKNPQTLEGSVKKSLSVNKAETDQVRLSSQSTCLIT